jgi:radical SAM protein with 4Fe4S-binding SPASM domain
MTHPPAQNELRLVFWESTAGCNLQCRHCRRLDVSGQLSRRDLTTGQGRDMIAAIRRAGSPILVFSGGEPLIRTDILELAEFAHAAGLPTALATNGVLVDPAMAGRIRDAHIRRVSVSLDGPDEATHNRLRRQPGCFAAACDGLRNLRSAGVSTQINCTVSRHNVDRLDELYRLATELAVDALHLFMLVPVGCGADLGEGEMLSAERYERVLEWLAGRSRTGPLAVKATCAPHYQRVLRMRNAECGMRYEESAFDSEFRTPNSKLARGCLAGTGVCFVSHVGEVFPCGYLPVSCGNVLTAEFATIWRDSPVFARLRDRSLLSGKCGACEFVRVCSGCRARAYAATGDFLGEEPYCAYLPLSMRHPGQGNRPDV